MGFQSARSFYESLPNAVRGWVRLVPFGALAGRRYRETVARGSQIDKLSRSDLESWQDRALKEMLNYAVDQVPAYHHLRGTVERFPAREALRSFPLLDKETLQQDPARYLPRDLASIPHYETSTGGSSGNQLHLYLDDWSHAVETGFIHRMWRRVGYRTSHRKATFRGVRFGNLQPGLFWQQNPIYNEMQFSPYHMSEGNLAAYVDKIRSWKPHFIHGYPSAVTLLARYLERNRLSLGDQSLKAVLLGSEPVETQERELIEGVFGVRAFSWYGHSEQLILAGECEKTSVYHHFPDYGVMELVDERGEPVAKEGDSGELVGTSLRNRSMPLIRYRTGDRARLRDWHCECGRCHDRFDQVEGRWEKAYIIGRTGARISLSSMNIHGPEFDRISRYQYYQDRPGVMELRIVALPGFSERDMSAIKALYASKTGSELQIDIRIVDDIPLTMRGKFLRLIQAVPDAS